MHVHLLLSTKCSSKSHLLEQLLTVLADPLLLVVARDVVPHLLWIYCCERVENISFLAHRFILPKSSGKCKAALLSAQNCVWFSGGGRGGYSTTSISNWYIIWIENNLVLKLTWAQPASLQHCLAASPAILGWSIILHIKWNKVLSAQKPQSLAPVDINLYLPAQPYFFRNKITRTSTPSCTTPYEHFWALPPCAQGQGCPYKPGQLCYRDHLS